MTLVQRLTDEKVQAILKLGFGGLIQVATRDLRHELCQYLVECYDVGYHVIRMERDRMLTISVDDVRDIMGIPCSGVELQVKQRRGQTGHAYTLDFLEQKLMNEPLSDEFHKVFLIFMCVTIILPNSKLEGMHNLWDMIMDGDVMMERNWGKFLLQNLDDGLLPFQRGHSTYLHGCLLFLRVFSLS